MNNACCKSMKTTRIRKALAGAGLAIALFLAVPAGGLVAQAAETPVEGTGGVPMVLSTGFLG